MNLILARAKKQKKEIRKREVEEEEIKKFYLSLVDIINSKA